MVVAFHADLREAEAGLLCGETGTPLAAPMDGKHVECAGRA